MSTTPLCPKCGQPLEAGAPQGLCPACLMQGAFPTGTDSGGKSPRFVPPTPAELAPQFPQLDLLEFIGQGGMGAVYQARQKALDRIVALKILPPDIGRDAAFAERFTREARALARLNHPGIVTIHEFGRTDGLFFFVMEFVDGVNLRQLLQGGRLSAREALAIVPQICDALQYAHDLGIVHRDIKPENILLDRRGRVKVADFGLAKIIGNEATSPFGVPPSGGSDRLKPELQTLTDAGKVMGTPQYMSPEQIQAPGEVDHRADIYALGVVLYQMLTGELPGKKIEAPSKKVQIDVRLDEIVLRALEKKPELRYQQASVLKTQIETIVAENENRNQKAEAGEEAGTQKSKSEFETRLAGAEIPLPSSVPPPHRWRDVFGPTPTLWCCSLQMWFFRAKLTSSLAIRLANLSELGFLGCIGGLGGLSDIGIPQLAWCSQFFRFFGMLGFFGLAGFADMVERRERRKQTIAESPDQNKSSAWKVYVRSVLAMLPMLFVWLCSNIYVLPRIKNDSAHDPARWHSFTDFPPGGFADRLNGFWTARTVLAIVALVILAELFLPVWRRHRRRLTWAVVALVNGVTLLTLVTLFAYSMQNHNDPLQIIPQTIQREVGRQLQAAGASYDRLQVALAEPRDSATPFNVSYKGLRHFKYTNGGQPDPHWPASADGQFVMQYIGGGQWRGALGDTPFAVQVGRTDNIDLPFVNDPAVLGTWETVGYVPEPEAFNPDKTNTIGGGFASITFFENGKTESPLFTWTKGVVMHLGDKTADHYEIQSVKNRNYLFMEWKNGNYMFAGKKPEYVVLRKSKGSTFYIGQTDFSRGDSIEIISVERGENRMTVKGHYNLVSADEASLWLNITATNDDEVPLQTEPPQSIHISKGRGDFELSRSRLVPGLLHVSMYNQHHAFASVYFGTKAEAEAERKLNLHAGFSLSPLAEPAVPDTDLILAEQPPVVVETFPVAGARDVPSGEIEIRARFSKPMTDASWSWCNAWEKSLPEFSSQPHYEADGKTCVLTVKLEAGRTYAFWLNCGQFKNFTDRAGVPAVPYLLAFQTQTNSNH